MKHGEGAENPMKITTTTEGDEVSDPKTPGFPERLE